MSHFYAMMSRMKTITRWGLMRNTRSENLSEHSLEVAMIAHALAVINNERFGGTVDPEHAATAALFHDTCEIITGDLPTPIKYYNAEIRTAYKQIEATAEARLTAMLPDYMRETFRRLYEPDEETERIIKAADKFSALIKCMEELGCGNREFAVAKQATLDAIHAMHLPEAEVFMEEFIPSFALSLDELDARDQA